MQFCIPVGLSMFKDKQMMEPVWRLDHRALEWEEVVQIVTWLPYHQYQVMGRHVLQPGHQAPREEVEVSVPALIVFKYLSKCSLGRSPQKKHAPEVVQVGLEQACKKQQKKL